MKTMAKAGEALERCEHELRGLGVRALQAGDYDSARRVTELAEALADRRARAGLADVEPSAAGVAARASTAKASASATPVTTAKASRKGRSPSKSKVGGDYPRFVRRGEKLIKVGWSKKNKQEYEHNAPWPAVLTFASHLRSRTRAGRIFTIEDLLPVPDPQNESELPGYQVYLALAWFRTHGLVEKRGREGYIADRDALADEALAQRWAALPSQDI